MTFTPHVSQLRKKGVTYLSSISPSKRCVTALSIAEKFFDKENFVPGFPDLLVVTNNKALQHKRFSKKFHVKVCSPNRIPKKIEPDLVWVDDLPSIITQIICNKFSCPKILTYKPELRKGMHILVDSREQAPLFIGNEFKRATLFVGDYTTEKLLDKFHIERKSPADLYSTITRGHRRFRDELIRAEANNIKLVLVVECRKKAFVNKEFDRGGKLKLSSTHIERIVNTIEKKYKLPVYWCASRNAAKAKVIKLLKEHES